MRQSFDEHTDPSFGSRHLPLIRKAMAAQGLDGFVTPHEDEHQNEYLPDANDRLAWATGFTGSAGAAVILKDKAAVFVDGRYTLQVRDQVDQKLFEIRDYVDGGVPLYLEQALKPGWTVGYDPRLHAPDSLERLKAAAAKAGASLKAVDPNPLDLAWGAQRPAQPKAPVVPHPLEYSGEDSASKRARVGRAVAEAGADAAVITAPASIAWLFNIRGGDVIRSPLPLAQAVLDKDGTARLFLDPAKVTADLPAWLGNQVSLQTPQDLPAALAALKDRKVLIDPAQSSSWYSDSLGLAGANVVWGLDPCTLPRACKNKVEIAGTQKAHQRDGVALTRFLHWLATEAQTSLPDEAEVVAKLEGFREATGALKDLSFDTIAGAGSNGAIVHYRPVRRLLKKTERGSLLLVDSGAQYLDGTTDVTRTVAIGEPSAEMRERYTLVLKGHLALGRVRFPAGTTGAQLDALARAPLWMAGLDYDHGTGHGVGSYLGVHEGPQRIAKVDNRVALMPGMIVSNEPGYYKQGEYGIRVENLQFVTEAASIPGGERKMLGFEFLTLAPHDRNLIEVGLLTAEERQQVDAYHARVLAEVGPDLPPDARTWLEGALRAALGGRVGDTSFRISPATATADVAAVTALFRAYAASLGVDLAYQDFEGELAALPGKYAPPAGALLLARGGGGEPIGCVALKPLDPDGCCEIKRLYVSPAARGMGLGKALVEAVLEAAIRRGYREVRLDTLPDLTAAIALYRAAGFAPIAPYYDTPVAGTVFLGRAL